MQTKDTDRLHPEGVAAFLAAIFRYTERDLKSKNDSRRDEARQFCLSPRCRLFVECAGGNYQAWLEARGLGLDRP